MKWFGLEFTLLSWHPSEEGMPKRPGWYLLKLEDGEYSIDNYFCGNWGTLREVSAWALLKPHSYRL